MDQSTSKLKLFCAYFFSFIGGIIVYFVENKDRFVKFHAMQSVLLGVAYAVIYIVMRILIHVPFIGWIAGIVMGLLGLGYFVISIVCIVKSMQGEEFRLPYIGDKAAEIVSRG